MTLVRVKELVAEFGGWADIEVGRYGGEVPHVTFFVKRAAPFFVADLLTAEGVTWPKGRVIEWSRDMGVLKGALDGFEVWAQFEPPPGIVTREEV